MVHSGSLHPLQVLNMPSLAIVILAAGQGKRMKSALPKVLHPIGGISMLQRVVTTASTLSPEKIAVVYGHGGDQVRTAFTANKTLTWAKQEPQLGTGHAVLQAMPYIEETEVTLVLYGDVPLIRNETLEKLVDIAAKGNVGWLTNVISNPDGLGRIIRDDGGAVMEIVEEKDATPEQRAIREINTGFLACPTASLARWLPTLGNRNAQGEYYLTDILKMAASEGLKITTQTPDYDWEVIGINSKDQLASLERIYQRENARALMDGGVTMLDPERFDLRGTLTCESDVTIDVNVIVEGEVWLGRNVSIGANTILKDCRIGEGTEVLPFTHIDSAVIGAHARIGPYARIRPDTRLADGVHVGNFVEVKASDIGVGSKANHLSYIGDSTVGSNVNIGAGTITCNYDGANKHRTVIGDNVHIGSDVQLIAPVTINAGATIGAGTTVWKDAPAASLTINPKTQLAKAGWQRPTKKPTN
jgi:bifunctional UDP-N-acetylglucosamine pyrophosphorylase / glucosamine-1-phosphate N-acetyltransferase